jgi:hypothetical protein
MSRRKQTLNVQRPTSNAQLGSPVIGSRADGDEPLVLARCLTIPDDVSSAAIRCYATPASELDVERWTLSGGRFLPEQA